VPQLARGAQGYEGQKIEIKAYSLHNISSTPIKLCNELNTKIIPLVKHQICQIEHGKLKSSKKPRLKA
jgi:hypothetical protein